MRLPDGRAREGVLGPGQTPEWVGVQGTDPTGSSGAQSCRLRSEREAEVRPWGSNASPGNVAGFGNECTRTQPGPSGSGTSLLHLRHEDRGRASCTCSEGRVPLGRGHGDVTATSALIHLCPGWTSRAPDTAGQGAASPLLVGVPGSFLTLFSGNSREDTRCSAPGGAPAAT